MLLEELVAAQRHYTTTDARLRKELEESQQARISDALDVQLRESAYAHRLQEEASRAMLESQQELVQQFQSNFEQHRLRTQEEHRATVLERQEQNDELQERLESVERALRVLRKAWKSMIQLPQRVSRFGPQACQPQHSSSFPSAPKGPLFSMPVAIPSGARELFVNMNPQATTTAHTPPQQQIPNNSSGFVPPGVTAPPAAEHGAPGLGNQMLLETRRAILTSLENLKGNKAGEDVKPKVKEAEEINLPEFPSPETYRSWKTAARETIRAASDSPDEAFQWVLEVYRPDASHDGLRDPGKFLTLDTKLLKALTTVSRGELAREILIFKETEASKDRAVRGRQVLYLFDQYFKTNEEVGSLYSVEDLLKVRLVNDDLSTFLSNWESVISGLSHMPDETTLRDIFLRELRQSKRMEYDLEIYDRAKGGSEQHTYLFLKNSIKEMLTRRGSVRTVTGSHAPTVISTVQQLPRDQPAPPEEVKVASPER